MSIVSITSKDVIFFIKKNEQLVKVESLETRNTLNILEERTQDSDYRRHRKTSVKHKSWKVSKGNLLE